MFRTASLIVLCAASVGLCDPPKLTIPAEIKAQGDYVTLTPESDAKAISFVPLSGVDPFPSALLRDPKTFVLPVRGLKAGRYRFTAVGSLNDEHATATFTVVVGDAPAPPPDVEPDEPDAPDEPDGPTTAPIDGEGNRVLIVYETGDVLPAKQAAILTSGVLRDYLDAVTAKDQANPTGAYRIWDKDVDLSHPSVSESWRKAMARPRQSVPWIVVSNGTGGYEGPLPDSVEATLELLKKHLRGK